MRRPLLPVTMASLGAVAVAFLALPLLALAMRTPWHRLPEVVGGAAFAPALRVSLVASLAALLLAAMVGIPLAWVLARHDFPGKGLVRGVATLPLVLPPVVSGVALLLAFGRRGVVGAPLAELGVTLPFSLAGVVLAAAFVAMPFLVLTAEAAFRAIDPRLEEVAASLGGRPWFVLRRVTLPVLAPSLGAGLALAWARALGEFGATITFAGNLPGRTQTMPLAVFQALERDPEVAYLLSFLLLAVSLVVMLSVRARPVLR